MLKLFVAVQAMIMDARWPWRRSSPAGDAGQATAEYALVLLGVAAIALAVAAWATRSGKVGQLFDAVIGKLISQAR